MNPILSISIATYNRPVELNELISLIFQTESDNFDVIINDNCSPENIKDCLTEKDNDRIHFYSNDVPISPYDNMITSIFKADGKYCLYCNDRDLIYPNELKKLITYLENNEFSFLQTSMWGSYHLKNCVYHNTIQSVCKQELMTHPTGIVFNMDVVREHLNIDRYFSMKYLYYSWNMLEIDLFPFGRTARVKYRVWGERPREFLRQNASGTEKGKSAYFMPDVWFGVFCGYINELGKKPYFTSLTKTEKERVVQRYLDYFSKKVIMYKRSMFDKNETIHYGLKQEFISTLRFVRIYENFLNKAYNYLLDTKIINKNGIVCPSFRRGRFIAIFQSLGVDIRILIKLVFPRITRIIAGNR